MAQEIVVSINGEVSRFGLSRLSREKLYGKKSRVIVDQNDEPCVAGFLTRDGAALIPPGCVASLYVDETNRVVERGELVAVDVEGSPVEPVSSTLGAEQPLEGPIDPRRVLDHLTTAVYQLDAAELGADLAAKLASGDIFEARFSYRGGFEDSAMFLLQNDAGFFALIGNPTDFEYVRREVPAVDDDDDDTDAIDDDDELDFGMM